MQERLETLETERRNAGTERMDCVGTLELVQMLHAENHLAPRAVDAILTEVATVVDLIAAQFIEGGRLYYVGAGTSGRLGVLDASECPPTFGVPRSMVQGVIAGGEAALTNSIEGAEDSPELGAADLMNRGVTALDVVVGIAASGRTPYVIGALDYARSLGARTVAVVNVCNSQLSAHADITLAAVTGPEALTGSTRLKAGTAQKLILNLLSTGAMVRLGKTYSNLMVDVQPTNAKLRDRAVRIIASASGQQRAAAETALNTTGGNVKAAIVMLAGNTTPEEAMRILEQNDGWVSRALHAIKGIAE